MACRQWRDSMIGGKMPDHRRARTGAFDRRLRSCRGGGARVGTGPWLRRGGRRSARLARRPRPSNRASRSSGHLQVSVLTTSENNSPVPGARASGSSKNTRVRHTGSRTHRGDEGIESGAGAPPGGRRELWSSPSPARRPARAVRSGGRMVSPEDDASTLLTRLASGLAILRSASAGDPRGRGEFDPPGNQRTRRDDQRGDRAVGAGRPQPRVGIAGRRIEQPGGTNGTALTSRNVEVAVGSSPEARWGCAVSSRVRPV